jgi:hypothetical protein
MKRFMKPVLIAVAIFSVAASSANAATIIDFLTGLAGAGGTVTTGANITGSGIFIDAISITGAPFNGGASVSYDVEGAGACLDLAGGCGLLNFNQSLNTISIVGSIPALGILAPITLLSGDLSGGVGVSVDPLTGTTNIVNASGVDTKAAQLLSALGLASATPFGFFGFTTAFAVGGQVINTDITNTESGGGGGQPQTPVPEPSSLLLFGTGLAVLARLRRRYSNKG